MDSQVLDRVRKRLIAELENAIQAYTYGYTKKWVNESETRRIVKALQEKTPIQITGPLWGDFLDGVVCDENLSDELNKEIKRLIQEGSSGS